MIVTFAVGGCAGSSQRLAPHEPMAAESRAFAIRFDNAARERVQVYLIGEQRQWLLGNVGPGAIEKLRIPDEAFTMREGFVRLVVLEGGRLTVSAAREPRAVTTVAQPMSAILSQQWTFSQGQVTPSGRVRAR
ncbi:MAG: hypothetical protein U0163_18780 [Gemmatimonadaceae bacterium]